MELIKPKSYCTARESIKKMKRQSTHWEKIFANEMTDKGSVINIYKQLAQLNVKETSGPIKKLGEEREVFQRQHAVGQQVHGKMLNIISHQGNANQNMEISPHTYQNGCYPKGHK